MQKTMIVTKTSREATMGRKEEQNRLHKKRSFERTFIFLREASRTKEIRKHT
jgi:hypothetical protein